ncbi:DUF4190 domain-containing protein [Microbacteriaceae bacterium VKM Ac-2854]|nr:DUF4190 domain-containing protein [Microbacteriaceae bacterium VKM Ac-2854]
MSTDTQSTTATAAEQGQGTDQHGASQTDPWAPTAEQQPLTAAPAPAQPDAQPQYSAQPQPPYGYPAAAYSAAPTAGFSITSLVLGVSSIFFGLTFIAPIAGLVFGIMGLRREPTGRTMAIWGIALNAVCLLGAALILVFVGIFALGIPFIAMADPNF